MIKQAEVQNSYLLGRQAALIKLSGQNPFPTQKEKNLISKHVENVSAGHNPKRIGKVPVDTSPVGKHNSDYYFRYSQPLKEDVQIKSLLKARRREAVEGPHTHRTENKRGKVVGGIDLSRSWKATNNPLTVAHEYYHARPTRNYNNIGSRPREEEEHYADLYASQADYNLKDVANFYNNALGGEVDPPYEWDPHLDDQTRLRLFAGMAR